MPIFVDDTAPSIDRLYAAAVSVRSQHLYLVDAIAHARLYDPCLIRVETKTTLSYPYRSTLYAQRTFESIWNELFSKGEKTP